MLADDLARGATAAGSLSVIVDRFGQRTGQRVRTVVGGQPPGRPVGDDRHGAWRTCGDSWAFAGHALNEHKPELLAGRCQRDDVGCAEHLGESCVVIPAGQKDVVGLDPGDCLGRMFTLPLPRMTADEDETGRG